LLSGPLLRLTVGWVCDLREIAERRFPFDGLNPTGTVDNNPLDQLQEYSTLLRWFAFPKNKASVQMMYDILFPNKCDLC
jgi:hypothetical protein